MHLDFDAARRQRAREDGEPLTFTLAGETFTCLAHVPIGVFADAAASGGISNVGLLRFVRGVLVSEDEERFDVLMRRKSAPVDDDGNPDPTWRPVDGEDLLDIFNRLVDVYTGRPTERPSDSPDGPPPDGTASNATSSPPDTEKEPAST